MLPLPAPKCCCCGQTLPAMDFYGLKLAPMMKLILTSLQKHGPNGASWQQLWGDVYRIEDEPLHDNSIRVIISRMNRLHLSTVGKRIVYVKATHRYKLMEVAK